MSELKALWTLLTTRADGPRGSRLRRKEPSMNFKRTLSTLCFSLALVPLGGAASTKSVFLRATLESSSHPTAVDTGSDGQTAVFVVAQGRSNLGPVSREGWVELLPFDGSSFCGPTNVQVQYRFAETALRFADGSRLLAVFSSGSLCANYATGAFEASGELLVVGGTGRLAGATGTLEFKLSPGQSLPNGFAVFTETFQGTLAVPPHGN